MISFTVTQFKKESRVPAPAAQGAGLGRVDVLGPGKSRRLSVPREVHRSGPENYLLSAAELRHDNWRSEIISIFMLPIRI